MTVAFRALLGAAGRGVGDGGGGYSPLILNDPLPTLTTVSSNSNQFGWRWSMANELQAVGLRIYAPTAVRHTLRLWVGGVLADSVTVDAIADEWVEGLFDEPVAIGGGGSQAVISQRAEDGSARDFYSVSSSALSFPDGITFQSGEWSTTDAYPTSNTSLIALVDLLYT